MFETYEGRVLFQRVCYWTLLGVAFFFFFGMTFDMLWAELGFEGRILYANPAPGLDWLELAQPVTMVFSTLMAWLIARDLPENRPPWLGHRPVAANSNYWWHRPTTQRRLFFAMLALIGCAMLAQPVGILLSGESWQEVVLRLRAEQHRTLADFGWQDWVLPAMIATGMAGAWAFRPAWARWQWRRWD